MSSSWSRPKPRIYEYNYQIQSAPYKPAISTLDERQKSYAPKLYAEADIPKRREPAVPTQRATFKRDTGAALEAARSKLAEMEEVKFPTREPLWKKHPYYVHEDTVRTEPHEGSIWPETRPHFDLVSSYDVMVGYLGIRQRAKEEAAKGNY